MSAVHLSERRFVPHVAVDLGHTLAVLQRGRNDPTLRISSAPTQTRVALTARISEHEGEGVAALLEQTADTTPRHRAPIRVIAWGHLAAEVEAFMSSVGRLLGFDDDWSELLDSPSYSQLPHAVRYARETHPGLRLSATRWVFKQGVSAIFEQRVTGSEAIGAWQRLTKHHGTPPPPPPRAGLPFPSDLRVFPTPRTWLDIPSWQWRQAGVDAHRRDAVRALRAGLGRRCAGSRAARGHIAHWGRGTGSGQPSRNRPLDRRGDPAKVTRASRRHQHRRLSPRTRGLLLPGRPPWRRRTHA